MGLTALAVVLLGCAHRAMDRRIGALVEQLGSDRIEERTSAQEALVRLGQDAQLRIREERRRASDPEVVARLDEVLEQVAVAGEDAWAVERIRKARPFPSGPAPVRTPYRDDVTVLQAIEGLSASTGVPIEFYPDDGELVRKAGRSKYVSPYLSEPLFREIWCTSAERLLEWLLPQIDAACVVERGRVVVVRMTSEVLIAKARAEGCCDEDDAGEDFSTGALCSSRPHANSILPSFALLDRASPDRRQALAGLRSCALDSHRDSDDRAVALMILRNLQYDRWMCEEPDLEFEGAVLPLFQGSAVPRGLMVEALRALPMCLSESAQVVFLGLLERGEPGIKVRLLLALHDIGMGPRITTPLEKDDARWGRFLAALRALSASSDARLAVLAVSRRAWEGDHDAERALAAVGRPPDLTLRRIMIEAAHHAGEGAARARFRAFADDPDPETRAAVAESCLEGSEPPDAEDISIATRLLDDAAPVVRLNAAQALGYNYMRHDSDSSAEEAVEGSLRRLRERLGQETDEGLAQWIRWALEQAPKKK